jgi:hypothetical protein
VAVVVVGAAVVGRRMLHQREHAAGHEPRRPNRSPTRGQLAHLDHTAARPDLNPPAGTGGPDLVGAGVVTRIDDNLNPVTLQRLFDPSGPGVWCPALPCSGR